MCTEKDYAVVKWRVGDVTAVTNMTDEEAADWLENNQKYLRDRLVELGNEALLWMLPAGRRNIDNA